MPIFVDQCVILICLVAIVKNESHIITEMLQSCLPYIDSFFIADTGSTDDTKKVIHQFMQDHHIPGVIIDLSWINFGQARSDLMKACHHYHQPLLKPTRIIYTFMMDADDLVVGKLSLHPLTKRLDAYRLKLKSGTFNYPRFQFLKLNDNEWLYKGSVHEKPMTNKNQPLHELIEGDYFIASRRLGARNQNYAAKIQQDISYLLCDLKQDPTDTRSQFYLALTYFNAKEWARALFWFQERLKQRKAWEEEWWSLLRTAQCFKKLKRMDQAELTLQLAVMSYPNRAEQFYYLSRLFEKRKKYSQAYDIGSQGCHISKPVDNHLWFDEDVYDTKMQWQTLRMGCQIKKNVRDLGQKMLLNPLFKKKRKKILSMIKKCLS